MVKNYYFFLVLEGLFCITLLKEISLSSLGIDYFIFTNSRLGFKRTTLELSHMHPPALLCKKSRTWGNFM